MRFAFTLAEMFIGLSMISAQYPERMTRPLYFETYKDIAIHEMQRSGVPASITLAQGALESADGNSRLARNSNNHFGIKCHNDWNGKKVFHDDDARNECFRKYPSVEDSYRDHSDYLKSKTRYAFLFELNITDYKGWARGLKRAGYATSSTYAEALIRIIEEYNLNLYDRMTYGDVKHRDRAERSPSVSSTRQIMERNRVKYILAQKGDSYELLTSEFGKLHWEIPQYNDIKEPDSLVAGQVIYIQPKRNKAEVGKNEHKVKDGETMYMISQLYAIKLDRLYAMNNLNPGTRPSSGTVLHLRKGVKKTISKPVEEIIEDQDTEEIKIDFDL
jgi:LysM repeat protein